MSAKDKILFVVNPISGTGGKLPLEDIIEKQLNLDAFEYSVHFTTGKGDATHQAKKAADNGHKIVVAVGGDGTINEVAQGLLDSETILAVIPRGSGNGFANYFNIPKNPGKAIQLLNTGTIHTIDTGNLNGNLFLSVAGLGFDARVSSEFDNFGSRGLLSYIWIAFKEYFKFKPTTYSIDIDGQIIERKAFLVTAANSSQFGNDAYIAPGASMEDGLLDLVIVKPLSVWRAIEFTYRLFTRTLNTFTKSEIHKARQIRIVHSDATAQVDGEPLIIDKELHIQVQPQTLKVLA